MKVIIPVVDNKEAKHIIAKGFHNTNYVCIYDSLMDTYEWKEKKEISIKEGNLCIQLKLKGIYNIITSDIELMTLALFTEVGLKVSKAIGLSVEENIKMFFNNGLNVFTYRDAMGVIDCACSGAHDISYN